MYGFILDDKGRFGWIEGGRLFDKLRGKQKGTVEPDGRVLDMSGAHLAWTEPATAECSGPDAVALRNARGATNPADP